MGTMQKRAEKENALKKAARKKRFNKKLSLFIAGGAFLIIVVVLVILARVNYSQSPEKKLGLGANIEEAVIGENGENVYIRLAGGSNQENIEKRGFIFKDTKGADYIYETSEGVSEISVPYERTFWDWLFKRTGDEGIYDYEINSLDVGLENFDNIWDVSVVFEYKEQGQNVETPVLDTQETVPEKPVTSEEGSGGSSGGGGEGGETCTPSLDCPHYYNSGRCGTGLSDGCSDSLGCLTCNSGFTCINNSCVKLTNCTNDLNCSYLNGACGTWLCNLTVNDCYINYNCSSNICRDSVSECDSIEYCSGTSVDCPVDLNESDGTECQAGSGSCQGGACVNLTVETCSDGIQNQDEICIDVGGVCGSYETPEAKCLDWLDNDCDGDVDNSDLDCVECINDEDCDTGEYCNSGNCSSIVAECTTDMDCDLGYYCAISGCQPIIGNNKTVTWHIQYNPTPLNPAHDVDYWNLDLYDIPESTIDELKQNGVFVICYFSAGSWEDWRVDASDFPEECIGNNLEGWPGERWLDTRCDGVREIMKKRIDLGIEKGCDGFDPDNMDPHGYNTGFPLTEQDAIDYYNFLADYTHSKGKKIGLKNSLEILPEVLNKMDWAVNEVCFYYDECSVLNQVIDQGKPVFHIEYGGESKANQVCEEANELGFSTLIKERSLNEFEIPCHLYLQSSSPSAGLTTFFSKVLKWLESLF